MFNKAYPYIGAVGIKNREEAIAVAEIIKDLNYRKAGYFMQIGVQVTPRVINDISKESNRRLPDNLTEVADIFECTREILGDVFNVVHYSERDKTKIVDRIEQIFDKTGIFSAGLCKAVQLNGYLNEIKVNDLERIKKNYHQMKIIMQINSEMMRIYDCNGTTEILKKILSISRFIDYVLIDPSGGEGRKMSIWKSVKLAKAIKREVPYSNLGVGFAGGMDWDNVNFTVLKIRQLLQNKNFSIDAESGLRDRVSDGYGNDDLNIEKVEHYLRNALAAFDRESYFFSSFKK